MNGVRVQAEFEPFTGEAGWYYGGYCEGPPTRYAVGSDGGEVGSSGIWVLNAYGTAPVLVPQHTWQKPQYALTTARAFQRQTATFAFGSCRLTLKAGYAWDQGVFPANHTLQVGYAPGSLNPKTPPNGYGPGYFNGMVPTWTPIASPSSPFEILEDGLWRPEYWAQVPAFPRDEPIGWGLYSPNGDHRKWAYLGYPSCAGWHLLEGDPVVTLTFSVTGGGQIRKFIDHGNPTSFGVELDLDGADGELMVRALVDGAVVWEHWVPRAAWPIEGATAMTVSGHGGWQLERWDTAGDWRTWRGTPPYEDQEVQLPREWFWTGSTYWWQSPGTDILVKSSDAYAYPVANFRTVSYPFLSITADGWRNSLNGGWSREPGGIEWTGGPTIGVWPGGGFTPTAPGQPGQVKFQPTRTLSPPVQLHDGRNVVYSSSPESGSFIRDNLDRAGGDVPDTSNGYVAFPFTAAVDGQAPAAANNPNQDPVYSGLAGTWYEDLLTTGAVGAGNVARRLMAPGDGDLVASYGTKSHGGITYKGVRLYDQPYRSQVGSDADLFCRWTDGLAGLKFPPGGFWYDRPARLGALVSYDWTTDTLAFLETTGATATIGDQVKGGQDGGSPDPWVYRRGDGRWEVGVAAGGYIRTWRGDPEGGFELAVETAIGAALASAGWWRSRLGAEVLVGCDWTLWDWTGADLVVYHRGGEDSAWAGPATVARLDNPADAVAWQRPDGLWEVLVRDGWRDGLAVHPWRRWTSVDLVTWDLVEEG